MGPTSSNQPDGAIFAGAYPIINTVTVSIGEAPAQVLWAGLVGAGLYQINVVVPSTLGDSDQPVVATVAGVSSQSSARLKVAASAKLSTQAMVHGRLRQPIPLSPYAKASLQRLDWLGGLNGHPQHSTGPSPLTRAAMQAAEAQGGIVQLA